MDILLDHYVAYHPLLSSNHFSLCPTSLLCTLPNWYNLATPILLQTAWPNQSLLCNDSLTCFSCASASYHFLMPGANACLCLINNPRNLINLIINLTKHYLLMNSHCSDAGIIKTENTPQFKNWTRRFYVQNSISSKIGVRHRKENKL